METPPSSAWATTSAPAGGTLPLEVVNTSASCLTLGIGYSFERLLGDGTWAAMPSNQMFITIAVILRPGQSYAKQAVIPADATPGTYRVLDAAYGVRHDQPCRAVRSDRLSARSPRRGAARRRW